VIAYPSLPNSFIKEEPQDDEDDHGESHQIAAYPPIPRSAMSIKEEVNDHEEIAPEIHLVTDPPIPRSAMAIKEELTDHEEIALEIHQVIK